MTVHRVVGIDLSLTNTGVCALASWGLFGSYPMSFASTGHLTDSLYQRGNRISDITEFVMEHSHRGCYDTLLVIELPAYSKSMGSNTDRMGLWWSVVGRFTSWDYRIAAVPPSTLKKWATGKGTADKAAVAAAVSRMHADVTLANSDEADATALATMGAHYVGWRPDLDNAYRAASLAAVTWPEVISA